jgi:hypothetical protein
MIPIPKTRNFPLGSEREQRLSKPEPTWADLSRIDHRVFTAKRWRLLTLFHHNPLPTPIPFGFIFSRVLTKLRHHSLFFSYKRLYEHDIYTRKSSGLLYYRLLYLLNLSIALPRLNPVFLFVQARFFPRLVQIMHVVTESFDNG